MESIENYLKEYGSSLKYRRPYPGHHIRFTLRFLTHTLREDFRGNSKMVKKGALVVLTFVITALPFIWTLRSKEANLKSFIIEPKATIVVYSPQESFRDRDQKNRRAPKLSPSQVEQTIFLLKQLGVETIISDGRVESPSQKRSKSPKS
ncbi:MAG: hypothetical protein WC960_06010 [Bacteroidales bacterium]